MNTAEIGQPLEIIPDQSGKKFLLPAPVRKVIGMAALIGASILATAGCSKDKKVEPATQVPVPTATAPAYTRSGTPPAISSILPSATPSAVPTPGPSASAEDEEYEANADLDSDPDTDEDRDQDELIIVQPEQKKLTFDPLAAIAQAKSKLRSSAECNLGSNGQVVLAVRHLKNPQIRCIKIEKNGEMTEGFQVVQVGKANGVNINFKVNMPSGFVLLAIKKNLISHSAKGKTPKTVIYTPYTADLNVEEIRQAGLSYLKKLINAANAQIKARRVASKYEPGRAIEGNIPMDMALTLAIIEHMDDNKLRNGEATFRELFEQALIILGANQKIAYNFAVSTIVIRKGKHKGQVVEGARGLFQFVRKTYNYMREIYPNARLHEDFVKGMNDHVNAAMAAQLLNDNNLHLLDSDYLDKQAGNHLEVGRMLASAYNGGHGRVIRTVKSCGKQWASCLDNPENEIYVRKFEEVWKFLAEMKKVQSPTPRSSGTATKKK
jgi:hypothetical protein